jgi:hypothetical protein
MKRFANRHPATVARVQLLLRMGYTPSVEELTGSGPDDRAYQDELPPDESWKQPTHVSGESDATPVGTIGWMLKKQHGDY